MLHPHGDFAYMNSNNTSSHSTKRHRVLNGTRHTNAIFRPHMACLSLPSFLVFNQPKGFVSFEKIKQNVYVTMNLWQRMASMGELLTPSAL